MLCLNCSSSPGREADAAPVKDLFLRKTNKKREIRISKESARQTRGELRRGYSSAEVFRRWVRSWLDGTLIACIARAKRPQKIDSHATTSGGLCSEDGDNAVVAPTRSQERV